MQISFQKKNWQSKEKANCFNSVSPIPNPPESRHLELIYEINEKLKDSGSKIELDESFFNLNAGKEPEGKLLVSAILNEKKKFSKAARSFADLIIELAKIEFTIKQMTSLLNAVKYFYCDYLESLAVISSQMYLLKFSPSDIISILTSSGNKIKDKRQIIITHLQNLLNLNFSQWQISTMLKGCGYGIDLALDELYNLADKLIKLGFNQQQITIIFAHSAINFKRNFNLITVLYNKLNPIFRDKNNEFFSYITSLATKSETEPSRLFNLVCYLHTLSLENIDIQDLFAEAPYSKKLLLDKLETSYSLLCDIGLDPIIASNQLTNSAKNLDQTVIKVADVLKLFFNKLTQANLDSIDIIINKLKHDLFGIKSDFFDSVFYVFIIDIYDRLNATLANLQQQQFLSIPQSYLEYIIYQNSNVIYNIKLKLTKGINAQTNKGQVDFSIVNLCIFINSELVRLGCSFNISEETFKIIYNVDDFSNELLMNIFNLYSFDRCYKLIISLTKLSRLGFTLTNIHNLVSACANQSLDILNSLANYSEILTNIGFSAEEIIGLDPLGKEGLLIACEDLICLARLLWEDSIELD